MKRLRIGICCLILAMMSCNNEESKALEVEVYETSVNGNQLTKLTEFKSLDSSSSITINPDQKFQTITGFGGAFTESSAYLLNQLSKEKRDIILLAYFSQEGAIYSLC